METVVETVAEYMETAETVTSEEEEDMNYI